MRGIADWDDVVAVPASRLVDNKQSPALVDPTGADHFDNSRMPALETRERLARSGGSDPAIALPSFRPLDDCKEIDVLRGAADCIVQEMCVPAHPELKGFRVWQVRQAMARDKAPESARAGITRAGTP